MAHVRRLIPRASSMLFCWTGFKLSGLNFSFFFLLLHYILHLFLILLILKTWIRDPYAGVLDDLAIIGSLTMRVKRMSDTRRTTVATQQKRWKKKKKKKKNN